MPSHTPLPTAAWAPRSQELATLMARAALGDRNAFESLYRHTAPQLFAVVLRIQRDRALAEELLQEVYVSVWRALGGFNAAQAQPMTWLASIARNRAIDSLRRAQAQPRTQSLDDDGDDGDNPAASLPDDKPGPLALLAQASDARELQQCMQALSAPQRQSVALAFYDGLSHAEVAAQLREPLGTVKSWVRRALQSLKGCLERAAQRDSAADAGGGAQQAGA